MIQLWFINKNPKSFINFENPIAISTGINQQTPQNPVNFQIQTRPNNNINPKWINYDSPTRTPKRFMYFNNPIAISAKTINQTQENP